MTNRVRWCLVLLLAVVPQYGFSVSNLIQRVTVSPAFFNPSLGQNATVTIQVSAPASITVTILDRDNYPIRTLPTGEAKAGDSRIPWDGRDEIGATVPDEAYLIRVEVKTKKGNEVYEPSKGFVPVADEIASGTYSRVDGILSYRLARPARVHIQAGDAPTKGPNGLPDGPVLKTILDRQPRIAGAVVERWNGFDDSGTIYVPDLPGFVVSVAAMSLPDNTLIAVGNRTQAFVEYARKRRPAEALKPRALAHEGHQHHQGLNAFEDHCPGLVVSLGGKSVKGPIQVKAASGLTLGVTLEAGLAPYFFSQPSTLMVFIDEKAVITRNTNENPLSVTIDPKDLPSGDHRLAVNWASAFGPVAVWATQMRIDSPGATHGGLP